jgi:hypothetical protein
MRRVTAVVLAAWIGAVVRAAGPAAQAPEQGPVFSPAGELARPAGYRSWAFVTSGLGMTYGPAQPAAGRPPLFDNVFVTRDAYREFLRSGAWPDRTMFVLELRRAEANVSINNGGHTQGEVVAIEASVKDRRRFAQTGGWAYFTFGSAARPAASAAPLPSSASCYACHSANGAVDNTFVQFYPELLAIARTRGTLKGGTP